MQTIFTCPIKQMNKVHVVSDAASMDFITPAAVCASLSEFVEDFVALLQSCDVRRGHRCMQSENLQIKPPAW